MLTAKLGIRYEDGWTSDLTGHDVYAEWPASTFYDDQYLGIIFLSTSEFETVVEKIRLDEDVDSVEVISKTTQNGRTTATLLEREREMQRTPMGSLLREGFLPLRPSRLENGVQKYDLIFENRSEIRDAIDLLSEYGTTTIESISRGVTHTTNPSVAEWQELLNSVTPAQYDIFRTAIEEGYFDIPRRITLEELGDELGITKATASHQLRKLQNAFAEFIITYLHRVER